MVAWDGVAHDHAVRAIRESAISTLLAHGPQPFLRLTRAAINSEVEPPRDR
jgi:hypothetical protein